VHGILEAIFFPVTGSFAGILVFVRTILENKLENRFVRMEIMHNFVFRYEDRTSKYSAKIVFMPAV